MPAKYSKYCQESNIAKGELLLQGLAMDPLQIGLPGSGSWSPSLKGIRASGVGVLAIGLSSGLQGPRGWVVSGLFVSLRQRARHYVEKTQDSFIYFCIYLY